MLLFTQISNLLFKLYFSFNFYILQYLIGPGYEHVYSVCLYHTETSCNSNYNLNKSFAGGHSILLLLLLLFDNLYLFTWALLAAFSISTVTIQVLTFAVRATGTVTSIW